MRFVKLPPELGSPQAMLAGQDVFSSLTTDHLTDLLAEAEYATLAPGDSLFSEGDGGKHWWLILAGRIELLRYGHDGEERIFQQFTTGQLVGEIAMFLPNRAYPVSARAATEATLLRFQRQGLHALCGKHPEVAIALLSRASHRLFQRLNEIDVMASTSAAERLASYLVRLCDEQGIQIHLPLTQRQLAARLGVRPETINRLLSEWVRCGFITGARQQWAVLALQQLRCMARGRNSHSHPTRDKASPALLNGVRCRGAGG